MSTGNSPLRGVWVAMPTPWASDGQVDNGIVRELVRRYAASGLDGAYTTGTDGEMHVLEFEELSTLVTAFAAEAEQNDLSVQIGCAWLHTDGVIRRGQLAGEHGVNRIQVAFPSWIPLADDEIVRFYGAIQDALPETELIHYNIARSGRMLMGKDYHRILAVAPRLAGSKHTGGDTGALIDIIGATPGLAHFVVDNHIIAGALFGSPGFYSFIANISPRFALEMMAACDGGDWATAAQLGVTCHRFFCRWLAMCPEINSSAALAKVATRAGVFPEMPLAIRGPYMSGTERHVAELRELIKTEFPELNEHGI
ncbi:dihydrodipicolinate synthase family protein [soil metagenome]